MKSQTLSGGYLLIFKKGDLLIKTLTEFCRKEAIKTGWISGIGAVSWAEIGFYNLESQEYHYRKFEPLLEITSLTGNIAELDNQAALHLHVVLADSEFRAYSGHLKEATVAGTAELYLKVFDLPLRRQHDSETGLNLVKL